MKARGGIDRVVEWKSSCRHVKHIVVDELLVRANWVITGSGAYLTLSAPLIDLQVCGLVVSSISESDIGNNEFADLSTCTMQERVGNNRKTRWNIDNLLPIDSIGNLNLGSCLFWDPAQCFGVVLLHGQLGCLGLFESIDTYSLNELKRRDKLC